MPGVWGRSPHEKGGTGGGAPRLKQNKLRLLLVFWFKLYLRSVSFSSFLLALQGSTCPLDSVGVCVCVYRRAQLVALCGTHAYYTFKACV